MAKPLQLENLPAYRLAAAMIHVDEFLRWKRERRKGPPATQTVVLERLRRNLPDPKRLSQSTVSRWLAESEHTHWEHTVRMLDDNVNADPVVAARARELALESSAATQIRSALPSSLSRRVISVRAIPLARGDAWSHAASDPYAAFALGAAAYITELLATGGIWGVTWGRNVGGVVARIVQSPANRREVERVPKFVPLCGDPFDVLPTTESSSLLAEQLATFFHAPARDVLSLRNVPAYLPERSAGFDEAEINGIKKLILRGTAYPQIFGAGRFASAHGPAAAYSSIPLADRLDGVITSLSSRGKTFGYGARSMIPVTDREKAWLDKHACDIGGVCLAHGLPNATGKALLNRIRRNWTGITYQQLESCAARASRAPGPDSPPGVVALAMEEDKVPTVIACLKAGLINHLICSELVAAKLTKELDAMKKR